MLSGYLFQHFDPDNLAHLVENKVYLRPDIVGNERADSHHALHASIRPRTGVFRQIQISNRRVVAWLKSHGAPLCG